MATMTSEEVLDEFQMDKLRHLLPVIVVMCIVCVLGIVGNSFTIAFYGFVTRRTPTIFLITVLACVDLIVCILIVPQIIEMAVNVKFTSAAACKLMHFFGHWAIETSTLMLWIIAIDRYRHVCCPLKGQMSLVVVKRATVVIIVLVLLLSIRDFVNFDIIEFSIGHVDNNATVWAHYCTTREDAKYKVSVTLFHSLDALVIIMVIVTLCFTYGRIVWTIKKGGIAFSTKKHLARTNESFDESETKQAHTSKPAAHDEPCVDLDDDKVTDQCEVKVSSHRKQDPNSNLKVKSVEKSITLMMFVVSIVFCICFVPYFVVKIAIRSYTSAGQLELGIGIQLAIRFVYVNSFANPVVFCFFNPQFRQYIRHSVGRYMPGSTSVTLSTKVSSQNSQ